MIKLMPTAAMVVAICLTGCPAAPQGAGTESVRAEDAKKPETITNSIDMKLSLIPAGEFQMGSLESERERKGDELQHRVRITQPFYLGVYEVTQEQYERIMGINPSNFASTNDGEGKVLGLDTSRFPVEQVSWDDAQEFCRKLSQKEGKTYRLPTEAEWEYACRAGTATPFNFGNTLNGKEANCDGKYPYGTGRKGAYLGKTTTVGSYRPNAFGLYDMHGNMWEWCSDWYDTTYYANSPTDNPKGPDAGSYRVIRGGGWCFYAVRCRSASRRDLEPSFRSSSVGFRVLRER